MLKRFAFLALSFGLGFSQVLHSDTQELKDFYQRVWSPYCKGNSLLECPSGLAEDLRDELRKRYQGGASLADLELYLVERYGNQIKMLPEKGERGMRAYWIPWLLVFFTLWGLALFWRKRIRKPNSEKSSAGLESNSSQEHDSKKSHLKSDLEAELRERLS